MSAAWAHGVSRELVTVLPFHPPKIHIPAVGRVVPTLEDARRVLDKLRGECERRRPPHDWPLVAFDLHWATAPRIGELAALVVADVDRGRCGVWLGRHEGNRKTGERFVVVEPGAMDRLCAYLDERGEVRPDAGIWPVTMATLRVELWRGWVRPAMVAAGVTPWTPHGVRGEASDHLADRVDEHSVTRQIGNTEAVRRKHYRTTLTDPLRRAMADRALVEEQVDNVIAIDATPTRGPTR